MRKPLDSKKLLNNPHVPKNYDDSPARSGIIESGYTEIKVLEVEQARDAARVQLKQAEQTIENQRLELRKLNEREAAWGWFKRAGYHLDTALNIMKELARTLFNNIIEYVKWRNKV